MKKIAFKMLLEDKLVENTIALLEAQPPAKTMKELNKLSEIAGLLYGYVAAVEHAQDLYSKIEVMGEELKAKTTVH